MHEHWLIEWENEQERTNERKLIDEKIIETSNEIKALEEKLRPLQYRLNKLLDYRKEISK